MDVTILLEKLCAIERAIEDNGNLLSIQAMVIEAGEYLLQLQGEVNDARAEADLLRRCIRNAQRSSLFRLSCPCISEAEASQMRSPAENPKAAESRNDNPQRPRFLN
jgi:hypothetical protein